MSSARGNWSPPTSPDLDVHLVVATDDRGMITDTTQLASASPSPADTAGSKRKRRTVQYVSRHFTPTRSSTPTGPRVKRPRLGKQEKETQSTFKDVGALHRESEVLHRPAPKSPEINSRDDAVAVRSVLTTNSASKGHSTALGKDKIRPATTDSTQVICDSTAGSWSDRHSKLAPWQQVLAAPPNEQQEAFQRIYFGLNVDTMSSDSDLTDLPDDIGPDPFVVSQPKKKQKSARNPKNQKAGPADVVIIEGKTTPKTESKSKSGLTKSPYFPHAHKPRPTFLSTLPFPPLHLEHFGLMQERLCHEPFRLLLATIFLNKTPGQRAMPIFFKLMERYPTPEKLAQAEQADVTSMIRELGFQNQRARKCIAMAQKWIEQVPVKGNRWRKPDYPKKGDGKNVKADEIVNDEDERVAWEISHLPGLGPYSHDSWRMFCRDELRGLASGYNGTDLSPETHKNHFEPEWKRVLPADKELRAWMTWMWMKEGWVWNKETGERTKASTELMELARGSRNVVLESDANTLIVKSLDNDPLPHEIMSQQTSIARVDAPAGDFLPS